MVHTCQQNKETEMIDFNALETMEPMTRASTLMESFSVPGSITKDHVEFIKTVASANEREHIAGILLNDPNGLLSNNARALVLKATGKWRSNTPSPLPRPYQSQLDE